jgi:hypothetical protein
MAEEKKSFLLRIDKRLLGAYQKWADDELRSQNGQIEYILRQALTSAGRLPPSESKGKSDEDKE